MPCLTTYQPGEIVLVAFPFTHGEQTKHRPALILLDTGDADVVVARVTTQRYHTPHDVAIVDWRRAGLRASSTVRLHKVATLERTLIAGRLGRLPPPDHRRVAAVMRQTYGSWS